jgi:hypothetical protein
MPAASLSQYAPTSWQSPVRSIEPERRRGSSLRGHIAAVGGSVPRRLPPLILLRKGPLWEKAVTQGDVWAGVDADLPEDEEWRALADERAWREAREAMRRDADVV